MIKETISNILKPKSEDELLDFIKDLSPEEVFVLGYNKHSDFLIKKSFELGYSPTITDLISAVTFSRVNLLKYILEWSDLDPSAENNIFLSTALSINNKQIIDILINDPRVREKLTDKQIKKIQ